MKIVKPLQLLVIGEVGATTKAFSLTQAQVRQTHLRLVILILK